MNENKKMFKVEGVEKFGFMVFVREKNGFPSFFTTACTADMIDKLPEKVQNRIGEIAEKWFDVRFVKKNREACYKAIEMKNKTKYTIEKPAKVWLTKNSKGYLVFIIECAPESIHKYEKEAKKDAKESDLDDLPF